MAPEHTDRTVWHVSADGAYYTTPRRHTIERLACGTFLLYTYGSGLYAQHASLVEAYRAARRADAN